MFVHRKGSFIKLYRTFPCSKPNHTCFILLFINITSEKKHESRALSTVIHLTDQKDF